MCIRDSVAPVWFAVDDDGSIVFTTGSGTVKGRTLRRDRRVCLCVDDDTPPFAFVIVEGTATIGTDRALLSHWATLIARRYMGDDRAEEYGRRNAVVGELLVTVTPTRIIGEEAVAD